MRSILILFWSFFLCAQTWAQSDYVAFQTAADRFFASYVDAAGHLKDNRCQLCPDPLRKVLRYRLWIDPDTLNPAQAQAYLLNLHQLLLIEQGLDSLPGTAGRSWYLIGNQRYRIGDLRNKILAGIRDSVQQSALDLQALSSPIYPTEAYRPEDWQTQLAQLAQRRHVEPEATKATTLALPISLNPALAGGNFAGTLIPDGQVEVLLFQGLSTNGLETTQTLPNGDTLISRSRATQAVQTLQLNYGLTRHRLNLGLEISLHRVRLDSRETSSPWQVFGSEANFGQTIQALGAIGPRVRWVPFRRLPELSLQSALLFPLASDPMQRLQIGRDRLNLNVQASFYQRMHPFVVFLQTGASVFFRNDNRRQTSLLNPWDLLLPVPLRSGKLYLIPSLSYVPEYQKTAGGALRFRRISYELNGGLGLYAQLSCQWGLTLRFQGTLARQFGSLVTEVIPGSSYSLLIGLRWLSV